MSSHLGSATEGGGRLGSVFWTSIGISAVFVARAVLDRHALRAEAAPSADGKEKVDVAL